MLFIFLNVFQKQQHFFPYSHSNFYFIRIHVFLHLIDLLIYLFIFDSFDEVFHTIYNFILNCIHFEAVFICIYLCIATSSVCIDIHYVCLFETRMFETFVSLEHVSHMMNGMLKRTLQTFPERTCAYYVQVNKDGDHLFCLRQCKWCTQANKDILLSVIVKVDRHQP